MTPRREIVRAALYASALAAINLYLCHNLFFAEYTGHMNSLQGLWISMARLAGSHWFWPAWWPYQDGGVPFEHVYMPLVPASAAALSHLTPFSPARAFYSVMGAVIVLGPVLLFVFLWRIGRVPGAAFWASLIYSVTAPARAVLPETDVNPIRYWSSLRFYGAVVWDDLPHQTAICLLPLALLFLWRSFETRAPRYYVLTVLAIAATVSASVFGATGLALAVPCMLATFPREQLRANLRIAAAIAGAAYLVISPCLTPSIIATIRSNQQRAPEDAWSGLSFLALAIVLLGCVLLTFLLNRFKAPRHVRFFVLFAFVATSIPLLDTYFGWHFIPQPTRYTAEMELALAMLLSAALAAAWSRIPRKIALALAGFCIAVAVERMPPFLRFTQESTRAVDITQTFEYRVARWIGVHMPGQRVMVPGSTAQWLNAFSNTPQLSGASFSTTPNWNQQEAMRVILTSLRPPQTDDAILWLKAFGVQAVTAGGRKTPEFWKGVSSIKFDYALPVLWREQDTTIYAVPQRSASLAHVIPVGAAGDLHRYVAALDDTSLPLAEMRWGSFRQITIDTTLSPGQVVSVQQCYHPGWHATANRRTARTHRDGLGMLLIEPECQGNCRIELSYNGGAEYIVCRALSYLSALGIAGYAFRRVRRPSGPRP
ncbi:MAG TPA: hypothetical protein VKE70_17545 [Candidatus Solibacter sp.]|nr:hypothetical protein [Candidatus Solibacter sp.]